MFSIQPIELARYLAQYKCNCVGCGWCCTSCAPISIDPRDIKRLAKGLGISHKDVMKKHITYYEGKTVLKNTLPCEFFDVSTFRCNIYEHRPNVCRMHPFMSNAQRDADAFWVNKECLAMMEYWMTYMNDDAKHHQWFLEIMEKTKSERFMKNAENTMRRLLKKKCGMADF